MIKCGECVRHDNCWLYDEHKDDNGTCVWAESNNITESPNEAIKRQNDVIKKPRTVRYKLRKPIEYVSIEVDEEETVTDIAHYNELVYCKDCVYHHRENSGTLWCAYPWRDRFVVDEDDYCSKGWRGDLDE